MAAASNMLQSFSHQKRQLASDRVCRVEEPGALGGSGQVHLGDLARYTWGIWPGTLGGYGQVHLGDMARYTWGIWPGTLGGSGQE